MSLQDKINLLLGEVRALGICADEVEAVRQAAIEYDRKNLTRRSQVKTIVNGILTTGLSAAGAYVCMLASRTSLPGQFICFFLGLGGMTSGGLDVSSADDELRVANGELKDAEHELNTALGALCRCIRAHSPNR